MENSNKSDKTNNCVTHRRSHSDDVTENRPGPGLFSPSAGCDVAAAAHRDPHVSVMEAGTSRSMPDIKMKGDAKKKGQKSTKKRTKVEAEEEQEEVRLLQGKKEQKRQVGTDC